MTDPVYSVDGALVPASEARVRVDDRGFQYGDGAFETLRAYGGTPFEWSAHRERLARTCSRLGMPDAVPDDARERVRATLAANEFDDAYLKICVTRGVQPGTLSPAPDVDPTVVVYAKPLPRGGVGSDPVWDEPARLRTAETRRRRTSLTARLSAENRVGRTRTGRRALAEFRGRIHLSSRRESRRSRRA